MAVWGRQKSEEKENEGGGSFALFLAGITN
jgi:hypothetical protein